jgi:hypothetical protein
MTRTLQNQGESREGVEVVYAQEDFDGAANAYINGNWQLANRYADRAKDREPKLNRDEFRRRAREEAKRKVGPIRGPQGEERWTETGVGPLYFS